MNWWQLALLIWGCCVFLNHIYLIILGIKLHDNWKNESILELMELNASGSVPPYIWIVWFFSPIGSIIGTGAILWLLLLCPILDFKIGSLFPEKPSEKEIQEKIKEKTQKKEIEKRKKAPPKTLMLR